MDFKPSARISRSVAVPTAGEPFELVADCAWARKPVNAARAANAIRHARETWNMFSVYRKRLRASRQRTVEQIVALMPTAMRSCAQLFDGDRLGEVARLIDVAATA